jgi:hypothetical protein
MNTEIRIKFQGKIPSIFEVLEKLREHTGLADLQLNENKNKFLHPLFDRNDFWVCIEGDSYTICSTSFRSWYLIEALEAVLLEIGGHQTISSDLPSRAYRKWEESEDFDDINPYENSIRTVQYMSTPPTEIGILERYRDHTGLPDIIFQQNYNIIDVDHPLLPKGSLFIGNEMKTAPEKSLIYIGTSPDNKMKSWYFVDAMLATLVSLGGETFEKIPSKAWKKWEEAKGLYENRF